jgi:hypothetical protein
MKQTKPDGEPHEENPEIKTRKVKTLADVALEAADAKQWQARKSGWASQEEASEVRNLTQDAEARAQAEAALQRMMAKTQGKPRGRY